jgi:hypothetical protein
MRQQLFALLPLMSAVRAAPGKTITKAGVVGDGATVNTAAIQKAIDTCSADSGTDYFQDKEGNWWDAYFGNDNQSPFREKPAIVKIDFDKDGIIFVSKHQPFVDDPAWK